ncbi:MAG: hypothetical protein EXX96DRAFT_543043 [Benjaminiella poitrasii]|nr:MAG: hypothetical protein EXX96DRAFT_543043 [Benjaminiella poitrasii]
MRATSMNLKALSRLKKELVLKVEHDNTNIENILDIIPKEPPPEDSSDMNEQQVKQCSSCGGTDHQKRSSKKCPYYKGKRKCSQNKRESVSVLWQHRSKMIIPF